MPSLKRFSVFALALLILAGCAAKPEFDILIYGGTSAGVVAAVESAKLGRKVVLIEPGQHLGGLTTGGLGATDIGNKAAIGGLSLDFYRQVADHYRADSAWVHEQPADYRSGRGYDVDAATMWTFEPHVAEAIMERWLAGSKVTLLRGERLDRLAGALVKDGARIVSLRLESGRVLEAGMYIDASYEGDLLAAAGVSYVVGREDNSEFGESLDGVQTANAIYHQFELPVSPYVVPGDRSSGLLPGINADGPGGPDGTGDKKVQAYNFRMCLTDVPENRIPFEKPAGYDSLVYEPLLRYFEAGYRAIPWGPTMMPNRKTDTNNNKGFSTDFIGQNYAYPEAGYAEREKIIQAHEAYQKGLMWTLANSPRVPDSIRAEVGRWGLAADEFTDNGGWPRQIYVREARRMRGEYVMTQHNCQGHETATDPVGLAAYTMDSHNIQRWVDSTGSLRNEGDVQVGGFPPYPISYRAILPKAADCTNLLVPVCLSATHIAYGSIRMEPVFMVLAQSAANAADLALSAGSTVQAVDYSKLRQRLLDQGQTLEWTGSGETH